MPPAAPKSKAANGPAAKGKPVKSAASTNGTSTPVSDWPEAAPVSSSKPDKAAYDAEQNSLKAEIDALQSKLVSTMTNSLFFPIDRELMMYIGES
jgi:hypothetical protein